MPSAYKGRKSALGLGVEGTWGTWQAAQEWVRLISVDLQQHVARDPRPVLVSGALAPMVRAYSDTSATVVGTFTVEAHYHELALLLEWAMYSSSTTGAGPYTHVQVLGDEPGFGLSLDVVRGGADGASDKLEGCVCTAFSLDVSAGGGPMRATFTVLGQTSTPRTTVSTPTFSTVDAPVLYHQCDGDFTWNGVAYKLIDYRLNVDNAVGPRIRLGSLNTLSPKRTGYMSVTTAVTLEVEDALVLAHIAGTGADYGIDFAGTSPYDLAIDGHNCFVSSVSDPISSAGIVTQSVTFTHLSDGTDDGLKITVINNESDNRAIEDS